MLLHLLKAISYFPLLVSKGIHRWACFNHFSWGLSQMDVFLRVRVWVLGGGSQPHVFGFSSLFNQRSSQKSAVSAGRFRWFCRKSCWKEWGRYPRFMHLSRETLRQRPQIWRPAASSASPPSDAQARSLKRAPVGSIC